MSSFSVHSLSGLNRRNALGRVGAAAAALGLSLGGARERAAAQEATPGALANHPVSGTWLAMANPPRAENPQCPAPSRFAAAGTVLLVLPSPQVGPQGVVFHAPRGGPGDAAGERRGHCTAGPLLSAATGGLLGAVPSDGSPEVRADGPSCSDDGSRAVATLRDARGALVPQAPAVGARAVTAIRMGVAAPGFPESADAAATPAASGAAAEGETATINGADLYYEVHGDAGGAPVLLHGGLGNTEEWDGLVPALVAAGYRTVAMDCRGRGRSTRGDAPITYELMAADTLGLLDHLGIDKTSFVGWSDGAIIGLELAIESPDRLERVVAYGANFTPDGFYEPESSPELDALFAKLVADYQRLSPAPERFEELLAEMGALYEVAPNFSEAELQSISVPILILDGAEEEMIKPDQPVRMAELIPEAELVIMPGTGHFAPVEQPDEFNRIVLDFLAS